MKYLKIFLMIIFLLAAVFFVVGVFLPSEWETSKSMPIQAEPSAIYAKVANLKRWPEWSPWKDADLSMVSSYSGPEEGVGAKWDWTSEKMGSGWLRVTEAHPESGIKYELFIDMDGSQLTLSGQMIFERQSGQTLVTWIDRGNAESPLARWKALIIGLMMKSQMSKGLEQLNILLST